MERERERQNERVSALVVRSASYRVERSPIDFQEL